MQRESVLSDRDAGAVKIRASACRASADQGSVKVTSNQQIQMYRRGAMTGQYLLLLANPHRPDIPAYRHPAT